MKNWGVVLICAIFLSSCSMGVGKVTEREWRTDPITQEKYEVVRETTPSFWKSENMEMGYVTQQKKIQAGHDIAMAKLQAIEKEAARRASMPLSSDARAAFSALDSVMIDKIRVDIPVGDVPIARGLGDYVGSQSVQIAQIAVGGLGALFGVDVPSWLVGGGGDGGGSTTYMDNVNIGGDAYTNGSIRKDSYDLGGYQATFSNNIPGGSVTEDNDEYTGNAQSSNGGGDGDTAADNATEDTRSLF